MKKKLLTLSLIVICVAILAAGTLAYFSDDATAHNVITTGGVVIELVETGEDGKPFPEEGISGVMPGESVTKRVTVKNTGMSEAWVRVRADMEVKDSTGKVMTGEHPIELTGKDSKWVAKDGAGDRLFNAHNAFFGVTYNNGFVAGLLLVAYTLLACVRAVQYYRIHRKTSPYAATPMAFCAIFVLVGMFESVYAPFSVIGCTYLLVQAPLWRADLTRSGAEALE